MIRAANSVSTEYCPAELLRQPWVESGPSTRADRRPWAMGNAASMRAAGLGWSPVVGRFVWSRASAGRPR